MHLLYTCEKVRNGTRLNKYSMFINELVLIHFTLEKVSLNKCACMYTLFYSKLIDMSLKMPKG